MRTIAFLPLGNLQDLDVFGPVEVFNAANFYRKNYEIVLLSPQKNLNLISRGGIQVVAHASFQKYQGKIDTLFVIASPKTVVSPEVLKWINQQAKKVRRICSICTGAFVLAEAGLLKKKRATTHWMWADEFQKKYPEIHLEINAIWTKDGKVYTSAGVSTGMDLALALVEEDFGAKSALGIAKGLVMYLRRSGGQNQFSELLNAQAMESDRFQNLTSWIMENLKKDLSVEALANHTGMSPRNFSRLFKSTFNQSPGEFVRKLRIQKAKELLESSRHDWQKIADICGLPNEALRRAFIREVGVSPLEYRRNV